MVVEVCGLCDRPGHICDPKTGECVCPPFTRGPRCEQCKRHYWGYDPVEGCKVRMNVAPEYVCIACMVFVTLEV